MRLQRKHTFMHIHYNSPQQDSNKKKKPALPNALTHLCQGQVAVKMAAAVASFYHQWGAWLPALSSRAEGSVGTSAGVSGLGIVTVWVAMGKGLFG